GAFVAEIGGHGAENVRTRAGEDDAAIVTDAFEFAGLVGDAEAFWEFAGNVAGLRRGKEIEEIVGELFVEDSAAVESFEEEHEFAGRGDVFAAPCSGGDVHHFAP